MDAGERNPDEVRRILVARLAVGLTQGLALYLLNLTLENNTWPATNGYIFAPLLFVSFYIPLLLLLSIGNLRLLTLAAWAAGATLVVAALAYYDIWHGQQIIWEIVTPHNYGYGPRRIPDFALFFFTCAGMFIAQSLIMGGDQDRRFIAHYATHFDIAWKLGLQLALAFVFVGIFWGVILLGVELFKLIGIDYFQKLIEHRWFFIPATTLAQAAAIHLTDVRAGLVRGTRTLVLVLLSWLLPLMTLIAAGFLLGLLFTGLAPLWHTGFAAGYLLIASAILIFLINAAFQDGDPERRPQAILRIAGSLASFLLLPFAALSAYAIHLRVEQYGWTTSRVSSTACLAVAAAYAFGYAAAAVPQGPWLARVARWNFWTALFILIVLGVIFSPLADPTSIAVDSQVARLLAGKIEPTKFDFSYLRWQGGRFGLDALARLSRVPGGGRAADIRLAAKTALAEKAGYAVVVPPMTPARLAANITVYPKGRALPESFLHQKWDDDVANTVPCLTQMDVRCDAYLLDLSGDGQTAIALIGQNDGYLYYANGLYAQAANGTWRKIGRPDPFWSCAAISAELRKGNFQVVAPPPQRLRDVLVGSKRLTVIHDLEVGTILCPNKP